jgi:endonuclease/exonuclease/phosphatase family metal-dependent hydrolase
MTPLRTGLVVQRERLAELGLDWHEQEPLTAIGLDGLRWGTRLRIAPRRRGFSLLRRASADGLQLLSLHLKSGCHYGALGGDDQARRLERSQCRILRRQRGVLEAWIDTQAEAGRPFVVAGDFNRQLDQPNDHFWQALDDGAVCRWRIDPELGRRCAAGSLREHPGMRLRLAGAGRPFPFALNPKFPYAIDHLVAGGPAADWVVDGSYHVLDYAGASPPSDHHPIRVRLALPWPGD